MKKIDTWLSIQRYVTEAAQITSLPTITNVEVWGKVQSKLSRTQQSRKARRFFVPRITNI